MAGAQQDIVVQVNPAPVTIQPASVVIETDNSATGEDHYGEVVEVRTVEPAAARRAARSRRPRWSTQSEGS